ncbi:MAG: hypothetical protein ACPGVH_02400 [Chitinophagales bacterium]
MVIKGKIIQVEKSLKYYVFKCYDMCKEYKIPFSETKNLFVGDVVDIVVELDKEPKALKVYGNEFKEKLLEHKEANKQIEGVILSLNDKGYLVDFLGFICFVKPSQVFLDYKNIDLNVAKGQKMKFEIKKIGSNYIRFSRRALLKSENEKLVTNELKEIKKGLTYIGKVNNVENYGLFIKKEFTSGLLYHKNMNIAEIDNLLQKKFKRNFKTVMQNILEEIVVKVLYVEGEKYALEANFSKEENQQVYKQILLSLKNI